MQNQDRSLLKDPKSIAAIVFIILNLIYIISPIDFIPDFIPVIGLIDDIIALLIAISIGVKYFVKKRS
ncbi:MAG TPA: YkvA family protein [Methanofastidiosum sp.]|nr:YkvA family protein [Methanofastidiosum sp.]HNU62652.1 YkvA family protein [Methanofastidiosum sp.]